MSVLAVAPAERIGALPFWGWIVNLPPWVAFIVMLIISPVAIKFIIRPLIEGRILRRSDEFMAFQMDIMFAPTLACGLVLVRHMDDRVYFGTGWFDYLAIVIGLGIGVGHFIQERTQYSLKALISPSKVYHELLFTFVGYLLVKVCAIGFIYAPWTYELVGTRVIMLAAIIAWAVAWPLYDEKHKFDIVEGAYTRYALAHVENAWPWQHKYRSLGFWLRRYRDDWRKTPGRLRSLYRGTSA
jgi:hypothetical protein